MRDYNIRPASFRGVPFGVTETQTDGGKRTIAHEFANKNDAYIEDLGRKSKKFSVTAFVVGADYMSQRDALITALDADGAGVLIHPFYGEITVNVDTYSISESKDDGGLAKFSINFLESKAVAFPTETANLTTTMTTAAVNSVNKAADQFAAKANVKTGAVVQDLGDKVLKALDVAKNKLANVMKAAGKWDKFVKNLAAITTDIYVITRAPLSLAYKVKNLVQMAVGSVNTLKDFNDYMLFWNDVTSYFDGLTYSGNARSDIERGNDAAIKAVFSLAAISSAAQVAADITFLTNDEATSTKKAMVEALEAFMLETDDDDLYSSAMGPKISIMKAIPKPGATLKNFVDYSVKMTAPAIVVSHNIYGNIQKEDEILRNNSIINPNAVMGWTEIKVIV